MDANSMDEKEVSSNSNMDKAVEIGIVAMQIMVANDMVKEVMVDSGAIDNKGRQ